MVQRAREPNAGIWSFPGGHVEPGEGVLEAARREALEETGVEVVPEAEITNYHLVVQDEAGQVIFNFLIHYIRCRYLSGEAKADSDALQARWVGEAELAELETHPFIRQVALDLLQKERG